MRRKHEENSLFEGTQAQFSRSALNQKFILPPFSVLSARDGEWQKRKAMWLSLGIKSEVGRGGELLGLSQAAKWSYKHKDDTAFKEFNEDSRLAQGTSIFDPVLCELLYAWFCPPGGKILDPFSGGSVRGIVAAVGGFQYSGCDLREEQVIANREQGEALLSPNDPQPIWHCGDSQFIDQHLPGEYDYVFSCPPYGDLEVYSEDEADISNMSADEFLKIYAIIIDRACSMLKDDSFACFVVGDYRDKDGHLANFPAKTNEAFAAAGLKFYNEAILVTATGSLPMRTAYTFPKGCKLGKTHQNILVYVKGDSRRAAAKVFGTALPAARAKVQFMAPRLPETTWTPPAELPSLAGETDISVDVETCDPTLNDLGPGVRRGGYIVGLAVGTASGRRWYFPMKHEGGGNLDPDLVLRWATAELNQFRGNVVGANLIYDLDYLAEVGVTFPSVRRFHDIQIAEPLLDEHRLQYNLDALAQDYLGETKVDTLLASAAKAYGFGETQKAIKQNLWRLPAGYVGPYGEGDADLPLRILPLQLKKLAEEGLTELFDLESRLIPLLLAMRRRGVKVNIDRAQQVRERLVIERDECLAELRRLAGSRAEFMAPDSFAHALVEAGVPVPRTPKTNKLSVKKALLEEYKHIPVVGAVLRGRKVNTIVNTFLDGHILGHHSAGRIHCEFNQLKGDDGGTIARFSSSNPNLQNLPARDEETGPLVRSIFEPEEGETWRKDDYSQIEYRLLVHYARGAGASEARRLYNDVPSTDYHKMVAEMMKVDPNDKIKRRKVKGVNFSIVYGAQVPKIAEILGVSRQEAQLFYDEYVQTIQFVMPTFEQAEKTARQKGYITTLMGRRQRFNLWKSTGYDKRPMIFGREAAEKEYGTNVVRAMTYPALNRLLQGGAADIMKKAMVEIWEAGICSAVGAPLLTVHDELDWSVPAGQEAAMAEAKAIMENTIKLRVPVMVESECGPNWGECK